MMGENLSQIIDLLKQIVHGSQCGASIVRRLESAIIEQFPNADDDKRFEQLMLVLASYSPQGGQYMYDPTALIEECRCVLSLLSSVEDKEDW